MPTMYKLTDTNSRTHSGMEWAIGKTNRATAEGTAMCTNQVLHCYEHPGLAVIFNPIHAAYRNPRLYEIHCSDIAVSDGLKFGCKEQTPVQEVPLPKITLTQKIAFSIKCALAVFAELGFVQWAEKWLSGEDRSQKAARAARAAWGARAAWAATEAAVAWAAAEAATEAVVAWAAAEAAVASPKINFIAILQWVLTNIS